MVKTCHEMYAAFHNRLPSIQYATFPFRILNNIRKVSLSIVNRMIHFQCFSLSRL